MSFRQSCGGSTGGEDDDDCGHSRPDRRRSHNLSEARRARRINDHIDTLKGILAVSLHCLYACRGVKHYQEHGRLNRKDKASVLAATIELLQALGGVKSDSAAMNPAVKAPPVTGADGEAPKVSRHRFVPQQS